MDQNTSTLDPKLLFPCHATNWMPFIVRDTAEGFEICFRDTPVGRINLHTALVATLFVAFTIFLFFAKGAMPFGFIAPIVIGIPTVLLCHYATRAIYTSQQRRGPVLVWNNARNTIDLPRESLHLPLDQVENCAVVRGESGDGHLWQLQLWTSDRSRYQLITTLTRNELRPMIDALHTRSRLPVRCFICESSHVWREEPFAL